MCVIFFTGLSSRFMTMPGTCVALLPKSRPLVRFARFFDTRNLEIAASFYSKATPPPGACKCGFASLDYLIDYLSAAFVLQDREAD